MVVSIIKVYVSSGANATGKGGETLSLNIPESSVELPAIGDRFP
jgi:hypothetical protein